MKAIISTLFVFLIVLASCSSSKNLQDPEYVDIENVRLIKVGLLQTTAGVDLVYYNPNDYSVELANARGKVYIDDLYLGRFELDDNVKVGKRSEFVLPLVFKMDNISAIKQRDIYKKKEAMVKIEGRAKIQKNGFSKDIPIKFEKMETLDKFKGIFASRK